MLISIIVPVYNVEKYIEKCLYRLAHQTNQNIEVILVNDGSPDRSQEIIDRYVDKYPRIFKSFIKENGGVSDARNFGLSKVTGDYIGFVDGDDYVEFDMFEKLRNKAVSEDFDIVICGYNRLFGVSRRKAYEDNDFIVKPLIYDYRFISYIESSDKNNYICKIKPFLWNKIYRRELFEGISFPVGQVFEDDAVIYKIVLRSNSIGLVNEPLYNYYIRREGSITDTVSKQMLDVIKSCRIIVQLFKDKGMFEAFYSEVEYLCIIHISARCRRLLKSNRVRLSFKFINNSYSFLNKEFPSWRTNRHYINNNVPCWVKHPLDDYSRVRNSALKFKMFVIFHPLIFKYRKLRRFTVRCLLAIEQLFKLSGLNRFKPNTKIIRGVSLTPEQNRLLQLEVVALLKKIDVFCTVNNITYYMSEGSLLGTVRHNGFIPWDDDIDIMMPRTDYDRFIKMWGNQTIDEMMLLHYSTYKSYYLPFAKLVAVGPTNFRSLMRIADDDLMGPSIDIFPLDNALAKDNMNQIKLCRKIRKHRNIVLTKVGYMKRFEARVNYFWPSRILTARYLLKKIDRLMKNNHQKKTDYIANFASSYPINKETFRKELFETTKRMRFEDIEVNIPSGYDKILSTIYGDYMTLPPVEKRVSRHSYQWIGPDNQKNMETNK